MVSFQNGVVYGTGNVLGYDKVGPEDVINLWRTAGNMSPPGTKRLTVS